MAVAAAWVAAVWWGFCPPTTDSFAVAVWWGVAVAVVAAWVAVCDWLCWWGEAAAAWGL